MRVCSWGTCMLFPTRTPTYLFITLSLPLNPSSSSCSTLAWRRLLQNRCSGAPERQVGQWWRCNRWSAVLQRSQHLQPRKRRVLQLGFCAWLQNRYWSQVVQPEDVPRSCRDLRGGEYASMHQRRNTSSARAWLLSERLLPWWSACLDLHAVYYHNQHSYNNNCYCHNNDQNYNYNQHNCGCNSRRSL